MKKQGYTFIHIGSDAFGISEDNKLADEVVQTVFFGQFTMTFFAQTVLFPFIDGWIARQRRATVVHRQFKAVKEVVETRKGPFFLLCHMLCPHEPYIFDKNGKVYIDLENSYERSHTPQRYSEQIMYLNKLTIDCIDHIFLHEKKKPIVVMYGDHGPSFKRDASLWKGEKEVERLAIFNSFFLPQEGEKNLYHDITLVNNFRVIFNYYFDTRLPLLPDDTFSSLGIISAREINKIFQKKVEGGFYEKI